MARFEPTAEQTAALRTWRAKYGRAWKSALIAAWRGERWLGVSMIDKEGPQLRTLRNEAGETWLEGYRLPKN